MPRGLAHGTRNAARDAPRALTPTMGAMAGPLPQRFLRPTAIALVAVGLLLTLQLDLVAALLSGLLVHELVHAIAPRIKQTYLYSFPHVAAFGKTTGLGAFHTAELPFVFGNFRDAFALPSADETALSDAIIGYFTRFAKIGDPGGTPSWPQYAATSDAHMVLDTPIATSTALDQKHCDALAALAP